jgi:hypothetical protein
MSLWPRPKKKVAAESLEQRIEALHKEIEAKVDEYLELIKPRHPGIPIDCLRLTNFARAGGCACRQYKLLQAKN